MPFFSQVLKSISMRLSMGGRVMGVAPRLSGQNDSAGVVLTFKIICQGK